VQPGSSHDPLPTEHGRAVLDRPPAESLARRGPVGAALGRRDEVRHLGRPRVVDHFAAQFLQLRAERCMLAFTR